MQVARRSWVCGSRNAFKPAVVLWQHFVLPNQTLTSLRYSSASATTPAANPQDQQDESSADTQTDRRISRKLSRRGLKGEGPSGRLQPKTQGEPRKSRTLIKRLSNAGKRSIGQSTNEAPGQEYHGQALFPMAASTEPEEKLPWVVDQSSSLSSNERLSQEIAAFYSWIRATPNETFAKAIAIRQLRLAVKKAIPGFSLEVFGSERTGLALPISDVDLRLYKEEAQNTSPERAPTRSGRREHIQALNALFKYLDKGSLRQPFAMSRIRHARYPLVTTVHKHSGVDIQVVLSNDTAKSRQYLQTYLREYSGLRELFSLLKVVFEIRGLSDVFRGGLGSYTLIMMIVASLQQMPRAGSEDLGRSLRAFLEFWAYFDTYSMGVSIEPPELFEKGTRLVMSEKAQANLDRSKVEPYLLSLVDPADAQNDLGRKGYGIKHIQATLAALSEELERDLASNSRPSLLAPLVGPAYSMFKARRECLDEYATRAAYHKDQYGDLRKKVLWYRFGIWDFGEGTTVGDEALVGPDEHLINLEESSEEVAMDEEGEVSSESVEAEPVLETKDIADSAMTSEGDNKPDSPPSMAQQS